MTYDHWKTTEPDNWDDTVQPEQRDCCGDWDEPDQVDQCDCCGAPNVPLTFVTVSNGTSIDTEWLCTECLPDDEPLDPMRGVESPNADNH